MFAVYVDKMMMKLWGQNLFNPKTKEWSESKEKDKRSFCMYVLNPICMVFDAIMNFKKKETVKLVGKLTTADDKAVKDLLRVRKDILLLYPNRYQHCCGFKSELESERIRNFLSARNPNPNKNSDSDPDTII
jgi:hypothetical protein